MYTDHEKTRDSYIGIAIVYIIFGVMYNCEVLLTLAIPILWAAVYYIAKVKLIKDERQSNNSQCSSKAA
jgi:hypothetical protein